MKRYCALFALFAAVPLSAQVASGPRAAAAPLPSAIGSAHELWASADSVIVAAAEQLPDSQYAYRPTPDVRSFGDLFRHITGAHYLLCGAVFGEKEKDIGKPTAKADVLAALKASIQYCEAAYAIPESAAMQPATVIDVPRTKLHALMMNAWHDNEHYGNIATYMRLLGMVPPSSQPKK